ncbi:enoyl-CoA hydratase/isomerase family protein [Novipirellula artificiosorum]|uniref:4-chlorobenzoyl coenzyme A dehalogenase-2 n=1 Tax=Novipirellula artificiosorum TaxID=2528016 RepID=A0A5C6E5P9_9BACT|nr:enoyl-CoA hydratase/isomerase family protein [Novipirellula artificiosorum]TWU42796.1 4-chlorobenzoyl coenzyme A dehalogenase-2 [Novipirellula artificiosorum]
MQHVDVKIHGPVATVMMNRADRHNALSPRLMEELQTAFGDIHQEGRVRAVVLAAAGEHFCAGIDLAILDEIARMPPQEALQEFIHAWRHYADLLEQILRFPKPVIAAVDGAAIGAGLGLALTADLMVVSQRATLSAAAVRRGLVDGATTALIAFRSGAATAAKMMLTGESMGAEEAYRRGLCEPPVAAEQIWVAASDLAKVCCKAPREAVQATKRALNEQIGETLMTQIAAGIADSAAVCSTDAAKEGVAAFLEKRDPDWL